MKSSRNNVQIFTERREDLRVHLHAKTMSEGKGVKGLTEKWKVQGWPVEEMKEKTKKLAERMEEEVLHLYKVEESKKKRFQRWR